MTSLQSRRSKNHATLDLFSTSPTSALQERVALSSPCAYNAPFFAYQTEQKTWHVTQGNCHHWDCPRCGLGRAKQEYGRMVSGCRLLAEKHDLFFITITCKGREITHEYAEENYGKWTNRLLDACRSKLNVRVVNGTMYRLLSAKKGSILTRILSRHFVRQSLRAQLYAKRKDRRADNTRSSYPRTYGLIGLKARSRDRGWASNTTLVLSRAQRAQVAMLPNTYLNPPFSRLIGLRDGSAYATLRDFHNRQKKRGTP